MPWPESITVSDTDGKPVTISDPQRFCTHLEKYHRSGVSLHTERGHAFRVDDAFRTAVQEQVSAVTLFR